MTNWEHEHLNRNVKYLDAFCPGPFVLVEIVEQCGLSWSTESAERLRYNRSQLEGFTKKNEGQIKCLLNW